MIKNLKKDELEVLNILSDVLNGNITLELPIEKYPVEDIFEEICFNEFSEKNPLNQVDCDVLGDNCCIETIIANVIHRETDLPVGYFKDANLDGAYIMYSPSYPWEASDNERKIKEKEDRRVRIMDNKKNILTYAGLKKLEDELEHLKVVKRKEVSQKIKEAREQGDLSENAEYDAAKDEQRDIEARIEEIEKILKNAEVVVEEEVDLDKISIGCKIRILDCEFDEELEYKIVGSTEANSLKGKISNESPVGKALLGKKVGDTVTVETQVGELTYKVLEIQRAEEN